jgi:hypothetical protein
VRGDASLTPTLRNGFAWLVRYECVPGDSRNLKRRKTK